MTIDSEVSGIMRASIGGKVNLNVLSGDVREESQAQSEEQEEKRKKKAGKRKNFKKCVIFKKKSPANTLFTGLFLVPVAGVEPARVISPTDFESASSANSNTPASIILSHLPMPHPRKRRDIMEGH